MTPSVTELLSDLYDDDGDGISTAEDVSPPPTTGSVKLVNRTIPTPTGRAPDIHIEPRPGKEKTRSASARTACWCPASKCAPSSYRSPIVTASRLRARSGHPGAAQAPGWQDQVPPPARWTSSQWVATVPTTGGMEDVVMRLLANSEPQLLERFRAVSENNFQRLADHRQALRHLRAGPTGSGKTTTLHPSCLINTLDTKIWTAEGSGRNHSRRACASAGQPQGRAGFPTVMRSPREPDVRDHGRRNARQGNQMDRPRSYRSPATCVQHQTPTARLNPSKVSARHGMNLFNFADALLGVLAQRLAKRPCSKCKKA